MRPALRILALALVGAFLSVNTSPAVASCAAGSGPAGSPTIFLGVAGETSGGYTTMRVDEVWAGPDLPASVRVLSGQTEPNVSSSGDADLEVGHTYVIGADRKLRTGACSVEEVVPGATAEGAMSLRPDNPRIPLAAPDAEQPRAPVEEQDSNRAPLIVGALVLLAAGAGVVLIRVRRAR